MVWAGVGFQHILPRTQDSCMMKETGVVCNFCIGACLRPALKFKNNFVSASPYCRSSDIPLTISDSHC